ncbi:MAG TPA: hypothetical protein VFQ22_05290 [Longimicrobiales bacterium]|nr:hypothetical protein [Longimicrobiales bacterium]
MRTSTIHGSHAVASMPRQGSDYQAAVGLCGRRSYGQGAWQVGSVEVST